MKRPKVDNSALVQAQQAAAAEQARANAAVQQAQQASQQLQKNLNTDLGTSNVATVVAGGMAQASDPLGVQKNKVQRGSGMASALGLRW